MKKVILIILIFSTLYSDEHYYDNGKEVYLKEVQSNHTASQKKNAIVRYYTTKNGTILGVNKTILVKCKKDRNCKRELLKHNVKQVEKVAKNYYLIHLSDRERIFTLSREIYNESYIESSHPDFEMTHKAY